MLPFNLLPLRSTTSTAFSPPRLAGTAPENAFHDKFRNRNLHVPTSAGDHVAKTAFPDNPAREGTAPTRAVRPSAQARCSRPRTAPGPTRKPRRKAAPSEFPAEIGLQQAAQPPQLTPAGPRRTRFRK
ncbi:uncharacterized protein A4U43_C08F33490 [Asparagus officinalis]|nr:uncharacterized protein A4U43_C08F33490 [Asparagus officinalis]